MICFIFLIRKLLKQTNSLKYEVKDKEKSKKKLEQMKQAACYFSNSYFGNRVIYQLFILLLK